MERDGAPRGRVDGPGAEEAGAHFRDQRDKGALSRRLFAIDKFARYVNNIYIYNLDISLLINSHAMSIRRF